MWVRRAILGSLIVTTLAAAGCSAPPPPPPSAPTPAARAGTPAEPTSVVATDDPAALAVGTSRALFASSTIAVIAGPADVPAAESQAVRRGAPLLVVPAVEAGSTDTGPVPPVADPAGVAAELARLGARSVLTVGDAATRWAGAAQVQGAVPDEAALPPTTPPQPRPTVLVLSADPAGQAAAVATARAAGTRVEPLPGGDPRSVAGARAWLTPLPDHVIGLGTAFGPADRLRPRLAVAATGAQLPGGGQVLFPGRRMIALYGHPNAPALGVLGEQDVAGSIARAQQLAGQYQPLGREPVVPAFEIIATVADAGSGADGDYSAESGADDLLPWVDAAERAGVYVVLDLQPGRADFLRQAQRYASLLRRPHVGLALDPEWRLGPTQVHRTQIGTVGVDEINRVVTWLADLTRDAKLPQKLLMVHQFRLSMIAGRERLDLSRDELAVVVHSDGFGTPTEKLTTWNALHAGAPAVRWGWKNFYDEDKPTFTPSQTVAVSADPPVFVSYQ